MPHGPRLPGWHLDPGQGAVHGCSGCSRGCGGPWQPQRQCAGMGTQARPWHDRHTALGPGALGRVCTPSPAPTYAASPGNSLPGGWLGQDQPQGTCSYLPRFASLLARWAALALSSQWGGGGLQDGAGGNRDGGKGPRCRGPCSRWAGRGHSPAGRQVLPLPASLRRAWAAGGLGGGTGEAAQERCPPSREAEGTGCPCPHCRLEPSPATAPCPAAAHMGGHGSNTQPSVLLCRQRNTPGG